jgi:hypothetical protein
MNDETSEEIEKSILDEAETDSGFAIAYAVIKLADAVNSVAYQLKNLGVGNAATEMGAIEYLATQIAESGSKIADAVREAANE